MKLNTYQCEECGEKFQTTEVLNPNDDDILCDACSEEDDDDLEDDENEDTEIDLDDDDDADSESDDDEEECD